MLLSTSERSNSLQLLMLGVPYMYLLKKVKQLIDTFVLKIFMQGDTLVVTVPSKGLLPVLHFFKSHSSLKFSNLIDIFVLDSPGYLKRFIQCYVLYSFQLNMRVVCVTALSEFSLVSSVYKVYKNARWFELELTEFFGLAYFSEGILVNKRLLTDYGFLGYPLKKDFPLGGWRELLYIPSQGIIKTFLKTGRTSVFGRYVAVAYLRHRLYI